MAGCGRLIQVYRAYQPKSITIVDISSKSIEYAREKYPKVDCQASNLISWINLNPSKKFNIIFGLWCLCYLK